MPSWDKKRGVWSGGYLLRRAHSNRESINSDSGFLASGEITSVFQVDLRLLIQTLPTAEP